MEFVLIRHTRCAIERGVCYGQLDVPLAATHVQDIERTLLRTPAVEVVFTSPSQRCSTLAERLAKRDRCELIVLSELQELNFGAWEGDRWDAIERADSDVWADDPWNRSPPRGETEQALFERVQRAFDRMQRHAAPHVAVVAHAGPLRLLRCLVTGEPLELRWKWMIEQGEVVVIRSAAAALLDDTRASCASLRPR